MFVGIDSIRTKNISVIKLFDINGNQLKCSYTGVSVHRFIIGRCCSDTVGTAMVGIKTDRPLVRRDDLHRGVFGTDRCIPFRTTTARNQVPRNM